MSRYFNSFMDNSSEALEHSWGTSPKAKAREKEYNHWYYQKHKDDIAEVRKRRSAATNYYKQAEKSHDDALRYWYLSDKIDARLKGYEYGPSYKAPDGTYHTIYSLNKYPGRLNAEFENELNNAKNKYEKRSMQSESKSSKLNLLGDSQKYWAKVKSESILQHIKNPTAKDLVEFYLDTTVAKAKKSASKAINKAKKYATKAMSSAEKSARKAKKYATKTIKSVVR